MFVMDDKDPVTFKFTMDDICTTLHFLTEITTFLLKKVLEGMHEIIITPLNKHKAMKSGVS